MVKKRKRHATAFLTHLDATYFPVLWSRHRSQPQKQSESTFRVKGSQMKRTLIIIVALAVLVPGALLAQDEISLESLAEQLTALVERVTAVEERVTALESEPDAGYCSPSVKNFHPMTIAGVAEEYPDHEISSYPDISFVQLNTETGSITVQWQSCCTEIVTEYYNNRCEWEGFDVEVD